MKKKNEIRLRNVTSTYNETSIPLQWFEWRRIEKKASEQTTETTTKAKILNYFFFFLLFCFLSSHFVAIRLHVVAFFIFAFVVLSHIFFICFHVSFVFLFLFRRRSVFFFSVWIYIFSVPCVSFSCYWLPFKMFTRAKLFSTIQIGSKRSPNMPWRVSEREKRDKKKRTNCT